MKVKKFKNPFIFGLLVGTCCRNLMTCIFLKTYQIKVIFSQNSCVCDKIKFYREKWKKLPQKMKSTYLCERLNLYQLSMQMTFVTNVSHIKMQNENYVFTSNKKNTIKIHYWFRSKVFWYMSSTTISHGQTFKWQIMLLSKWVKYKWWVVIISSFF
jgi:hypothetical protein